MNPLDWSLLGGPLPVILLAGALLALGWLVAGGNAPGRGWLRRWLRRGARGGGAGGAPSVRWLAVWVPLIVVAAAGIVALVTWLINNVWRPFPDLLPFPVLLWSWVALAGLLLAFARQLQLRTWPRRVVAVAAGVLVLAAAANQVNGYFQADPSLRAVLGPWLDQKPVFTGTVPAKQVVAGRGRALEGIWDPPRGMPAAGAVYQADIPGVTSGFKARPGYIYLPPAYLTAPRPQLPVLVLLAGQPGDPRNWVDWGQVQAIMDGFARAHDGLAPVVVMPDDLGSYFGNTLCLDSRLGDAQTYLTVDVPNWVTSHLQVRPPGQGWAVAGVSEGGTCAIQLATQAPRLYRFFVDISGQIEPTLGSRQLTVSRAFGGDAAAFARVNPIVVLARTRFPRSAGVFVAGTGDRLYTPQQQSMYLAARRAGMSVRLVYLPGGHGWGVGRSGLQANLAWLADRLGMTGGAR